MSSQRIFFALFRPALIIVFLVIALQVEQPTAALNRSPPASVLDQAGLCASVTEIPTAECDALMALYNSTNGANWTNHTGWNVTNTPCSWYGITCTTGHVTRVELSSNQVTGSLPSQLGSLPQLEFLIFQANQLTGNIPPELGSLSNLKSLGLPENQLSGNIPPQLGNLTNLWWLSLNSNQLTGSIPSQLGNMTNLRDLRLENNQLTGTIPSQLANLTSLQELVVSKNQLTGSIPSQLGNLSNLLYFDFAINDLSGSIPPELGNLPNLLLLSVYGNQLSGSIPPELGNLGSLQMLVLGSNQLSGTIPPELGSLTSLQTLALNGDHLSGSIPPELGNLSNLQELSLYDNQFSGSIPAELGNLANLEWLNLGTNNLSGSIPDWIDSLTNLKALNLYDNQFSGNLPVELGNLANLQSLALFGNHLTGGIPPELGDLLNLTSLDLSSNQLSGSIPPELGNLSNLAVLYLKNNQLGGSIPPELANLTLLDTAGTDLGYNSLTATGAALRGFLESRDADWDETQTVPPTNFQTTGVTTTTVTLGWTPILYTGDGGYYVVSYATAAGGPYTIAGQTANKSASSFTVTSLTTDTPYYFVVQSYTPAHGEQQNNLLSAYSQEISETPVSDIFSDCAHVIGLSQQECNALMALYNGADGAHWTNHTDWAVTKTVCSWYGITCIGGHVSSLELGNNGLNGNIPAALGDLAQLQTLNLGNNGLSGSIPPELGDLTNLQHLRLYENELSGSIPPELGNLTNLVTLDLYTNNLSGGIPPELGSLSNVLWFNLYINQLTGDIPSQLGNLSSVKALSLGLNQLSGSIPPELGNLSDLEFLDLSTNQLTGSVPSELGNLTHLQNLYLSNNQLSGSIPSELGSLTDLHDLFLSENQLSGDIPSSLTNLTALNPNRTDLGYNQLTATGALLLAFLDFKDGDWDETQTVAPINVQATDFDATSVTLGWTPILYTGDGGYYVVSYATAAGGPYTAAGQTADKTEAAFTINSLTTDSPYYFVVQSYTPAHGGQQSELLSDYSAEIQVTPTSPTLDTPILLQPADNSTTTDSHPAFTWNGVAQADHYEFQIGVALPLISEPIISAVPAFTPANNLFAHTYSWRVRAVDALGGTSAWSNPFKVTIESPLTERALRNRYTTNTPTLTWGEISWADRYEVQVAADNSFDSNSLVYTNNQILSDTLYVTTDPLPNGTYYWHVRALEADGTPGDWSAANSFGVDVP